MYGRVAWPIEESRSEDARPQAIAIVTLGDGLAKTVTLVANSSGKRIGKDWRVRMVGGPPLLSTTLAVWINHEKVHTPCHFGRSLPMSFPLKPDA
jgi:hypothetical protein